MELQGREDHHCAFCDFTSAKKSKLESHMRRHTREKPFVCDQCKRGFAITASLNLHIRTVHKRIKKVYEKKHKCFLCPYATHHRASWEVHTQAHLGERSFSCQHPDCTYAAKTQFSLQMHNISKHQKGRKFVCQFPSCGYRGKTSGVLNQHMETHSENRPFVCDFGGCSYRSKRKGYLQKHKLTHNNDRIKPFACTFCNYCTTSSSQLSTHQLSHMKEKPIKCHWSGCNFSCKINKNLQLHVLNCHTDKIFKCDIQGCHSTAATLLKLEYHKKIVHYDKAYKCPNCEYRAAIPSLLEGHVARRHIANKRIPCPTNGCTFRAKTRCTLYEHMRYHEANLGCPLEGCGYVAHSSSSLKQHMQFHDPTGRPFPCPLCPKHFALSDQLTQHLKTHTQEKPFQCPACNFETTRKSTIIQHVSTFHRNVSPKFDDGSICDHCGVNFGCPVGLDMHRTKLKTAVVVLKRLQLKM